MIAIFIPIIHAHALLDESDAKAETELTTLLAGDSIESLEQERTRLRAFCGELLERYPAWGEQPPDAARLAVEAQEIRRDFIARVESAEVAWKEAQKAQSTVAERRAGLETRAKETKRQEELLATKRANLIADGNQVAEREAELGRIALTWEAARAGLEESEKALAEFGADPREDVKRLERQIQAADDSASKALAEESREEGRMESLLAQGPYSELARAEEDVARLRRELAAEELRIAAIKLLRDTVAECRSAAVVAPVEAAATRMLQRIAGSRLGRVQLGDAFEPGHVLPELADGSVSVEQVSGGEQEQIYLATRLALAEVLARGEQQLVVLDEVLTATDAGRLARVMGILEEAA